MRARVVVPLALGIATLVAGVGAAPPPGTVGIGEPVGALALEDLDGRAVRVEDHAAHPVTVLWFWSTLCPCNDGQHH
jgi:hypothetical protein